MARASSKKSVAAGGEENPEATERKRLKTLALSKGILSDSPANSTSPLSPSNIVKKHHGKDIIKKSQRKNRFLFSFPGLVAPITGGKIGELKDLGTKNPILYLDFPQGQMKLFGTIIYPKNRYLTLLFPRGGKNVMCEDYFDHMIVFSDAWWIGAKDENPEEARLDFPKELFEGHHIEYDFKGGAGASSHTKSGVCNIRNEYIAESPKVEHEDHFSDGEKNLKERTPCRQSERTSRKSFNFAEASSGDDSVGHDDVSVSEEKKVEADPSSSSEKHIVETTNYSGPVVLIESDDGAKKNHLQQGTQASISEAKLKNLSGSATSLTKSKEDSRFHQGSLIQASISTMFKKVEKKVQVNSVKSLPASKVSGQKLLPTRSKRKISQVEGPKKKKKVTKEEKTGKENNADAKDSEIEDEIDEFSNTSKDTSGSDEDWVA